MTAPSPTRHDESAVTVVLHVEARNGPGMTTVECQTMADVARDLDAMDAEGGWTDVRIWRVTSVVTRTQVGDPR